MLSICVMWSVNTSPTGALFITIGASCSPSGVLWYYVIAKLLPVAVAVFYLMCKSSRDLQGHVRVLYLLLFLNRAGPEAAAQLLQQFREPHAHGGLGLSVWRLQLPPLTNASGEP